MLCCNVWESRALEAMTLKGAESGLHWIKGAGIGFGYMIERVGSAETVKRAVIRKL